MAVYLPTAALGNSQLLVTLGASAEVMSFFYPDVDYSQNVYEWMTAVYVGAPGQGRFIWTWDGLWDRHQEYLADTNVVVTRLQSPVLGLALEITDFADPELPVFHRRFALENRTDRPFQGALFQYVELRLGEVPRKQSVRYLWPYHGFLQYHRDIAVAVGGDRPDGFRCGKSPRHPSGGTKADLEDGVLFPQTEDIGDVTFALSWRLDLPPRQSGTRVLYAAAGPREREALRGLAVASCEGMSRRLQRATDTARQWLDRARPVELPEDLRAGYHRALLSSRLLASRHSGAIIAAPEFDPTYSLSGGYGYCWPRDACETARSLAEAGYPEIEAAWCEWLVRTQGEDGRWQQRYWSSGDVAPAWCLHEGFEQLDQDAASVLGLAQAARRQGNLTWWPAVRRGAQAVEGFIGPDGLHRQAADLWEIFRGTFVYTNAAIAAALREAAQLAREMGEPDLASRWEGVAATVKQAVLREFWREGHFIRGRWAGGELDWTPDSATLGAIEPFELLSRDVPAERRMIEQHTTWVEQTLRRGQDGGCGILRFPDEAYLGGVIGAVNTLWLAEALLAQASWKPPGDAAGLLDRAEDYMRFVLRHATPTGLLPELIGHPPGPAYWAAPHGWCSGLFIRCALALSELRERIAASA